MACVQNTVKLISGQSAGVCPQPVVFGQGVAAAARCGGGSIRGGGVGISLWGASV